MRERIFWVYVLTNIRRSVFYTGITNDLYRRLEEHRYSPSGFTGKYHVTKLVYFEQFGDAMTAIEREKQVKDWRREKKLALIRTMNPLLEDLSLTH